MNTKLSSYEIVIYWIVSATLILILKTMLFSSILAFQLMAIVVIGVWLMIGVGLLLKKH